ncbi:MAG TPA: DUF2934 domain-containing protein [Phycisphaerales bacterium]|nr:DUF2934 domain-containing protein [Phycisphaerales bacterium]
MPEETRTRNNTRKHTEAGEGSRAASATSTAQSRRMTDRLDESGAPVLNNNDGIGRAGNPASPPVTGASLGQKMGNAQLDPETAILEEIRIKAYERWLTRGQQPGSAEEDWREAEKEVRGKLWSRGSGTEPGI